MVRARACSRTSRAPSHPLSALCEACPIDPRALVRWLVGWAVCTRVCSAAPRRTECAALWPGHFRAVGVHRFSNLCAAERSARARSHGIRRFHGRLRVTCASVECDTRPSLLACRSAVCALLLLPPARRPEAPHRPYSEQWKVLSRLEVRGRGRQRAARARRGRSAQTGSRPAGRRSAPRCSSSSTTARCAYSCSVRTRVARGGASCARRARLRYACAVLPLAQVYESRSASSAPARAQVASTSAPGGRQGQLPGAFIERCARAKRRNVL